MQRIDRGLVGRREMHPEQARPRPLAQRDDVMLAAGAAQVNRVAFGGDILQGPDLAIEFRGFLQVVDAQFDAAQAVDSGVAHGLGLRRVDSAARYGRAGSSRSQNRQFTAETGGRGDGFCIPPRRASLVAFAPRREQIHSQEPV